MTEERGVTEGMECDDGLFLRCKKAPGEGNGMTEERGVTEERKCEEGGCFYIVKICPVKEMK